MFDTARRLIAMKLSSFTSSASAKPAKMPMPTELSTFGGRAATSMHAQPASTAPRSDRPAFDTGAWIEDTLVAVAQITARQVEFTTDDLWPHLAPPAEPRALGNALRLAQARGLCEPTDNYRPSKRPECHSRPIRVWKSVADEALAAA